MTNKIIQRTIFNDVIKHISEKEITVIIGARQTGKTTLLAQIKDWLLANEKIKPTQIKSFNLDIFSDYEDIREQSNFIHYIKENLINKEVLYVFIDEVQRLENPGRYLKGIYDLDLPVKFIVTGSSSLEIKSKIFESLAGRKKVFHLWPFSFKEYLNYREPDIAQLLDRNNISEINRKKLVERFFDFVIYGGYPKVLKQTNENDKIETLKEIYSSYIEKDVINFLNIRNPLKFNKLIYLLAGQIGNLVNHKEISETLGINIKTLENYLYAMENTFIINLVRPYYTNHRKELTKMPKVFFIDNGLRNFTLKYFASFDANRDKGKLFENFIYSSLLKVWNGSINYWRSKDKNEVDFILSDYKGNIFPLEVKSTSLKKPALNRGLKIFIEKYNPKKGFVANQELVSKIKISKTNIFFISPLEIENIHTFLP